MVGGRYPSELIHSEGQRLKGGPLRGRQFGAWIFAWGTRNQKQRDWMRLVRGTQYGKGDGQHCTRYLSTLTADFSRPTTPTLLRCRAPLEPQAGWLGEGLDGPSQN